MNVSLYLLYSFGASNTASYLGSVDRTWPGTVFRTKGPLLAVGLDIYVKHDGKIKVEKETEIFPWKSYYKVSN